MSPWGASRRRAVASVRRAWATTVVMLGTPVTPVGLD